MGSNKLNDLPPLARATALAMDRPYRPGHARRVILVGIAFVAALVLVFLSLMPPSQPRVAVMPKSAATSVPEPQDGVVYQNLRAPAQAPPARHEAVSADAASSSGAKP